MTDRQDVAWEPWTILSRDVLFHDHQVDTEMINIYHVGICLLYMHHVTILGTAVCGQAGADPSIIPSFLRSFLCASGLPYKFQGHIILVLLCHLTVHDLLQGTRHALICNAVDEYNHPYFLAEPTPGGASIYIIVSFGGDW